MSSSTLIEEVMAPPCYPTDNEAGFDSHPKQDALSIPHTFQSDSQQELAERNLGCISMGAELEAKGRGPTRRRIPVAVNSSILQTKVHVSAGTGWPYPPNDLASQRSGIDAPSVACKVGGGPRSSSNHRTPQFLRAPDQEVASDGQISYGRHPFGIDSAINYEDGFTTPYSPPSSTYMLPSSPQASVADYCGLAWNSRSWNSGSQGGRAPGETMFAETDSENSLANPTYNCVIYGQGPQPTGTLGMESIQASLTSPVQGTERGLPTPSSRNTVVGNNNGLVATSDSNGLHPTQEYKLGSHWRHEGRTPVQSTSNTPVNTATVNRTKLIPSSAQDTAYGVLTGAPSNASSPLIPSSGTFADFEATGSAVDAGNEFRGAMNSQSRTCSLEHNKRTISPAVYRADYYGYSRPPYRSRLEAGGSSSESTLITGLPYERPKHPSLITTLSPDEFSDCKPPPNLLTPVSALSNANGF
ncbi:uncharacterized protein BJX67DRAFT_383321 [Aspergillus lucknowensis]|uniref:Hemagglutinin protein n=1 Tax=Aspergillus lucknowensis TaxID=176173 RepID=A0ABR4LK35_9EURO